MYLVIIYKIFKSCKEKVFEINKNVEREINGYCKEILYLLKCRYIYIEKYVKIELNSLLDFFYELLYKLNVFYYFNFKLLYYLEYFLLMS